MIERGCTAVVPPTDDPDILLLLAAAPAIKTHGAARRAPTLRSAPNKRARLNDPGLALALEKWDSRATSDFPFIIYLSRA